MQDLRCAWCDGGDHATGGSGKNVFRIEDVVLVAFMVPLDGVRWIRSPLAVDDELCHEREQDARGDMQG